MKYALDQGWDDHRRRIVPRGTCGMIGFFGFWLILTHAAVDDLIVGIATAIVASWASRRLMPAERWSFAAASSIRFVAHFLRQSIVAGTDVALRALDPRLPMAPGFVTYHPQLPPGLRRNAFCAITSLMPGTLPCGSTDGDGIAIHCLDITQPVLEQLFEDEALCIQTIGKARRND